MAERNDMTAALVTAYTSPQLAAINEYLEAEKAVRAAAEILGPVSYTHLRAHET